MYIGIPKESLSGERRVALIPSRVADLKALKFDVVVEEGAGIAASFSDAAYVSAEAAVSSRESVWAADVLIKVNPPTREEIQLMRPNTTLIALLNPTVNAELLDMLAKKTITCLALDSIPRISRAQSMDVLSSMANLSGYRATIEAAHAFGRLFAGQITAAGKVPPARVMVIGGGVAGLAAAGTARSLGAVVSLFDTRPEVKEQAESMGAEFLTLSHEAVGATTKEGYAKEMSEAFLEAERALFAKEAPQVDIIITTAAIPGKPAPTLLTHDIVALMQSGSVIVDLAAIAGGNCEATVIGTTARSDNGVIVIGYTDFPSRLPAQSSLLYTNNVLNLLKLLTKNDSDLRSLDFSDEIIHRITVVSDGKVRDGSTAVAPKQPATEPPLQSMIESVKPQREKVHATVSSTVEAASTVKKSLFSARTPFYWVTLAAILIIGLTAAAPAEFFPHLTIFSLSCIAGYYVVWGVTHALHTPLMSVTNAISGIIVIGALLQMGTTDAFWVKAIASLAVLVASINIFGGFSVTHRMLKMFQKRG